ncbi:MAG: hypothetical protein PHP65_00735 [Bacilli bacterium]|jgi:hypothetical protein|nr:hypothetical protein [Bacilli bacterium]
MVLNSERSFLNVVDLRTYQRLKEKEKIQKKAIENKEIKPISNDMIEDIKKFLGDIY